MYQAIEAISKAGVIEPLEPVVFEENEPLVILRLPRHPAIERKVLDWKLLVGSLKDSPHLNGDALATQQDMRREWD